MKTPIKTPKGRWGVFQTPQCYDVFDAIVVHVHDRASGIYARDKSYSISKFEGAPLAGAPLLAFRTVPTVNGWDAIIVIRNGYTLDRPFNPSVALEVMGPRKCGTVELDAFLVRPLFAKDIEELIDPDTLDWDQTSHWNVNVYKAHIPSTLTLST